MNKKIGYFSWTFAADIRFRNGLPFSSPDSALMYFFTSMHVMQEAGYETWRLAPDRDYEYVQLAKEKAFTSFSQEKRWLAYSRAKQASHVITDTSIECNWPELDLVILEYRMKTWRNILSLDHPDFDPDLILQDRLIEHYLNKNTPIICLDLDYAVTEEHEKLFTWIYEPGFKRGINHHFDFPFYLEDLTQFPLQEPENKIVYVGNRYVRDEAFDKYLGEPFNNLEIEVWGNWLESNRDSEERWPHINFKGRAQPYQIKLAYEKALAVPLLLKEEYNQHGFMTVRPLEVILFGSIPMLPTDFFSPIVYPFPRIQNRYYLEVMAEDVYPDMERRNKTRKYMIDWLEQHHPKYFLKRIERFL